MIAGGQVLLLAEETVGRELTDLLQTELQRDAPPTRDESAIWTWRLSGEHSEEDLQVLQEDACNRAFKFVPSPKKRVQICKSAKELGAVKGPKGYSIPESGAPVGDVPLVLLDDLGRIRGQGVQ